MLDAVLVEALQQLVELAMVTDDHNVVVGCRAV
jgi:hypothetical protein